MSIMFEWLKFWKKKSLFEPYRVESNMHLDAADAAKMLNKIRSAAASLNAKNARNVRDDILLYVDTAQQPLTSIIASTRSVMAHYAGEKERLTYALQTLERIEEEL